MPRQRSLCHRTSPGGCNIPGNSCCRICKMPQLIQTGRFAVLRCIDTHDTFHEDMSGRVHIACHSMDQLVSQHSCQPHNWVGLLDTPHCFCSGKNWESICKTQWTQQWCLLKQAHLDMPGNSLHGTRWWPLALSRCKAADKRGGHAL